MRADSHNADKEDENDTQKEVRDLAKKTPWLHVGEVATAPGGHAEARRAPVEAYLDRVVCRWWTVEGVPDSRATVTNGTLDSPNRTGNGRLPSKSQIATVCAQSVRHSAPSFVSRPLSKTKF